jgi:lipopolysaccharide/colanic/teichoic acid biosynthesis glycosyltransferase
MAERRARLPVRDLLEARVRGCIVEDGVNVYERLTGKLAIETLTPSTLIFSGDFRKSRLDLAAGRCISLLVSVAGLVLLSPLLALVALAIKIDSRGPVFFIQDRVGMAAHRFRLIKFRTMQVADGPTSEWVRDNATRITRVGKWLRRYRLDELPQFFNVMRGDMNLVGPRPHPVSNFELFSAHIPYYWLRAKVRPGITGWAQVRYQYANNLDEETEKMRYDLYYIKHLSIAFDLRILFDTVKTIFFGLESVAADGRPVSANSGTVTTQPLEAAK